MTKTTSRSIWFVSCVAIGLVLALVDGIELYAIIKTALLAAVLFVAFLLGEAAWLRYRNKG